MRGGRPLSRGTLYNLLGNPLYAGRVAHYGTTYQGQHPSIIDPETWETVQSRLADPAEGAEPSLGESKPSPREALR